MTVTMIDVDGGTVWADDSGGDGPPLVLLHPGVGDSRIWDPVLPALTETYRAIRYDARGFGQSPAPTVKRSLLRDLIAVLDHYGLDRTAIVGCSQGGASALGLALDQPARVSALVLLCPASPGSRRRGRPGRGRRPVPGVSARRGSPTSSHGHVHQSIWGPAAPPRRDGAVPFRRPRRHEIGDLEEEDPAVFDRLGQISVPSSLMVGDPDFPPLVLADKAAAARIPGCELVLVHGMDHLPPLREPDLVLQRSPIRSPAPPGYPPTGGSRPRGGVHGPFGHPELTLLIFGAGRAPDGALGGEHADDQQRRPGQLGRAGGLSEQRPRSLASATTGASSTHGTTWPEG